MRTVSKLVRVFVLLIAAFALAAAPAVAQEGEESSSGVTCDPENPSAGSTTQCTAEGLMPSSPFEWTAEFTDGSTAEGKGEANLGGTGNFTVEIPESTPVGGYQVTVTGENPEGEEYEESHQGLIAPSGGEDGGDDGGEDGGDDGGQDGGDDGGQDGGTDDSGSDDFGEEEGEGSFTTSEDTPQGGVATGAGGTAGGSPVVPLLVGLFALAALVGTVLYRRRTAARAG